MKPITHKIYLLLLFIISCCLGDLNAQNDCPSLVTLTENPTTDDTLKAGDTIISTVVINSPSIISYKAGETIILKPGFEVKQGATFSTSIEECIPSTPKYEILLDEQNEIISVDSNIIILASSAIEDSLEVGVYIVSPPQEFLPNGFLGRIDTVTKVNDQIILITSEAAITDFLENGSASGMIELTEDDIESTDFRAISQSRNGVDISRDFSFKTPFGTDTITASGNLGFTLSLVYDLEMKLFRVTTFELGMQTGAGVSVNLGGSLTKAKLELFNLEDLELGSIKFKAKVIWLNGVPIVITPKLVFVLNASGEVAANFSFNAHADISGKTSIRYEDGNWSPIFDSSTDVGGNLNFFAEGIVEADLSGRLDFQFYNLKNVTVSAGAGVEGKATANLDLINGSLECVIEAEPKAYMEATLKALGFEAKAELDIPFEPFYMNEDVCKFCNLQLVDSTEAQANTDGDFELKVKVTTTCGNLPMENHPVTWSYTVDGVDSMETSMTDNNGFAKLNWSVPSPRIRRNFITIVACADEAACRTIKVDETRAGFKVYLSQLNYSCNEDGENEGNLSGEFGLNIGNLQHSFDFNGSSNQGLILNEQLPVYYSIGDTDFFPNEVEEVGNIFYNYNLTTSSGFFGVISFVITQVGNKVINFIDLDGDFPDEISEGQRIEYGGDGRVEVNIRTVPGPVNNCWQSGLTGSNIVPILIRKDLPAFNKKPETNSLGSFILEQRSSQFNSSNTQRTAFEIFPNPARNAINISHSLQNGTIEIVDMFGNSIINQILSQDSDFITLDISTLSSGTYFVKCYTGNDLLVKKIVVNN